MSSRPPSAPPGADPAAIERELRAVIERLRPRFRQILGQFRIPPQHAEDLLQETFLAALRRWHEIERKEGWLCVALRNRCLMWLRDQKQREVFSCAPEILELLAGAAPAPQEHESLQADLQRLMARLRQRDREILRLKLVLGLTDEEVAHLVGCRAGSVRKLCSRAVAALRDAARSRR